MVSQSNTVFLGYSQDAIRRLPRMIASALRQYGYDVYMNENHFGRFDSPPQFILDQIERRSHYVLLLTPASLRYGFNLDEPRLTIEVKHAVQTKKHIVVLWAYSQNRLQMSPQIYSFFSINSEYVELENANVETIIVALDRLLSVRTNSILQLHSINASELKVETFVDQGLTQVYDSMLYNRGSNAVAYFNEALNLESTYARAYFERASHYYWQIFSRIQEVDVSQILADYDAAIHFEPDEARYYAGRAELYAKINNYQAAIEDYTTAIQYASGDATYYNFRAMLYHYRGNFQNALSDYSMAIQIKPQDARYYYARSEIYTYLSDFQSALNDMNRAIELDPAPRYFVIRGFLHSDLGYSEKADADWNTAVEVSKNSISEYLFRAHMHFRRGEMLQALAVVEQALIIEPDSISAQQFRDRILNLNAGMPFDNITPS